MMTRLKKIKDYFSKIKNKEPRKASEGMYPNCWSKEEWDGYF